MYVIEAGKQSILHYLFRANGTCVLFCQGHL